MLEDVELGDAPDRLAARLSGGMKRKLSRARWSGRPSVVLLDEPSAGLDPVSRRRLWTVLRRAMVGRAVVLTTHSMEGGRGWQCCTRTAIMARRPAARRRHAFISEAEERRGVAALDQDARRGRRRRDHGARCYDCAGRGSERPSAAGVVQFTLADRENMSEVFAALEDDIANGELGAAGARDFTLEQPKLEDVFMRVVARAAEEDEAPSGPPAPAAATDDVEAPLATPLLDATPGDAASDELARCCFGLDRRAHAFLAWVLSICALLLSLT